MTTFLNKYLFAVCISMSAGLLFYDALYSMVSLWVTTDTYMHGLFVIPLVIMMVSQMKAPAFEPSPIRAPLFILLPLIWGVAAIIATQSLVNVLQQLVAISIVPMLVLLNAGWRYLWHYKTPLLLLFLCIPFGDFLVPYLQSFTADVSVFLLRFVGVPVLHNGWYISIAEANFRVAEACSGVNFLISTFVVSIFYAFTYMQKTRDRSLFIMLGLFVPLVANCIRVFLIVIVAHLGNIEAATGFDHIIYGWFFFAIILLILFAIGHKYSDPPAIEKSGVTLKKIANLNASFGLIVLMLTMVTTVGYTEYLNYKEQYLALEANKTSVHDSEVVVGAIYKFADSVIVKHIDDAIVISAIYNTENSEKKMISYNNQLFDKKIWSIQSQKNVNVNGNAFELFSLVDIHGNKGSLYRRYQVDNSWLVSHFNVKWALVKSRILGRSFGGKVELIFIPEHMDSGALITSLEQ